MFMSVLFLPLLTLSRQTMVLAVAISLPSSAIGSVVRVFRLTLTRFLLSLIRFFISVSVILMYNLIFCCMKKFLSWLKDHVKIKTVDGRLVIDVIIASFAVISCSLWLTSCASHLRADHLHYDGCIGKGCSTPVVIVNPADSLR